MTDYVFQHKDLLDIGQLSQRDILAILDLADEYVERNRRPCKKRTILESKTLINMLFENSTRTRTSFEMAAKWLGCEVVNMEVEYSSVKKGETLVDTAATLNAMHPDFIVVRHSESGAVHLLAEKVNCSVINAGDGSHSHPTQALLDAVTIRRTKGSIAGLEVAICGDITHSRVARSNMELLKLMGAKVRLIAPPTLIPYGAEVFGVDIYHDMQKGLKDVDVVMMLRVQQERMSGSFIPSLREYFRFFGLDRDKLSYAKPDACVLHPGPINRGVEISGDIADDLNRSMILQQVEIGVAVRQAVLELLSANPGKSR